jgi:YD repeat-containing protein
VAIDAETTPTKAVFANPDGTKTAKISQAPVRFKDGAGKWVDFDLGLVSRPDGRLGAKAAPQAATLNTRADGAVATVQTSAGPVSLRHPGAAPAAAAMGTLDATYAKALSGGRDLKVVLTPDGFEESVILPDATAAASYRDEIVLPAGVTVRNAKAGIEVVDKTGTVVSSFGNGFAFDAATPTGAVGAAVSVTVVSQTGTVATVEVAISDPTWLGAPERSFPATIDPTWAQLTTPGSGGLATTVIDGPYANTAQAPALTLGTGLYNSGNYHFRTLLGFDVSSLSGATVTAAQINMYNLYTGFSNTDCTTKKTVSIYGLAAPFTAATTWNTQPGLVAGAPAYTTTFANQAASAPGCSPNWVGLPVTSLVQSWVGGGTNNGVELRSDENDMSSFQAFWSANAGSGQYAPYLYVTLNDRLPNPPTAVVATPNANGSVGVTWTAATPNGGSAIDYYLLYALNPDFTYAGSYAIVYPPAANVATLNGLDRSRPYIFGVYSHNAVGYTFAPSSLVTTAADPLAGAGDQPWFSYDSFGLNDRLGAKVNLGNGNLVVGGADLTVPVVGGARPLGRTYNSLAKDASSALFGYGWRFSEAPDRRLEILYDGSARYWSPSGNPTVFGNGVPLVSPPYALSAAPGIDATLVHNANGTYTLTFHASQEVLTFRSDGLLTADADRYANTVTYAYGTGWEPSITGTAGSAPGNTVNIAYGGPGGKVSTLTQTADSVTRTVGYTYDAAGNLWKVTDAKGGVTTFGYDATHRMTSITGPGTGSVAQVTNIAYDSSNRVISVSRIIPGDTTAVTTYDYATAGHTKVTDPDGHPAVDYTVDSLRRVTAVTDPKNPSSTALVTYGAYSTDNKVQSSTNASGGTTTYDWTANAGESLKSTTDPTGAVSASTYTNTGPLAWSANSVSDTLGITTAIGYNGTVPDPRTMQNTASSDFGATLYNTDGTVSSSTTPNNVSTTLLQILLQDTTKSTRYAYFATHQLQTVTPPAGTSLGNQSFTYDGAGRLKTATSGKGIVTTLTYDSLDRVTNQAFRLHRHRLRRQRQRHLPHRRLGNHSVGLRRRQPAKDQDPARRGGADLRLRRGRQRDLDHRRRGHHHQPLQQGERARPGHRAGIGAHRRLRLRRRSPSHRHLDGHQRRCDL